jgi:hypothetical protein
MLPRKEYERCLPEVGTGGLNIYGGERRTVDNISGWKANYLWKNEIDNKWKDSYRTKEINEEVDEYAVSESMYSTAEEKHLRQ